MLILDISDKLLEYILHRDKSRYLSVLIHNHRKMTLFRLHLFKQIIDVYRLGYEVHRPDKPVYVLDTAAVNLIFFKKCKSILDM